MSICGIFFVIKVIYMCLVSINYKRGCYDKKSYNK